MTGVKGLITNKDTIEYMGVKCTRVIADFDNNPGMIFYIDSKEEIPEVGESVDLVLLEVKGADLTQRLVGVATGVEE